MSEKKGKIIYPDGQEKIYCGEDSARDPVENEGAGDLSISELSRRLRVCESSILSLMSEVHPVAEELKLRNHLEHILKRPVCRSKPLHSRENAGAFSAPLRGKKTEQGEE